MAEVLIQDLSHLSCSCHIPPPPVPILRSLAPIFFLSGFLPCHVAPKVHLSPLCGTHPFPSLGWKLLWALRKVGRAWGRDVSGETGEEEVSWVPGKTSLSWWVETVIASFLDTQAQTRWIFSGYISLSCIRP